MSLFGFKKVNVVCAQYIGRTERVQLQHCKGENGQEIYTTAGCDFFSPCERCQECIAALLEMFNQGFEETAGKPVVPNVREDR